jgi:2-hydroxychromene-2-carboxylate isomerase
MSAAAFDPLSSAAPLIIYIDYKSPYAYLAKDPTYSLEDELGIEVDWRPFTLDIPSYLGSARLDDQGRLVENQRSERQWSVVRYSYRDVRRYGARRGLIVRGTTKIWNSSLAAIGMLWAKEQGRTVLRRYSGLVYERFWKRELDIEDIAVVERALAEAGALTAGFQLYAQGEGRALHDAMQQAAFEAGIFGVPTYVVGGEIFFGREHLPRIRWILNGRNGSPPDVAYEHETIAGFPISAKPHGPLTVAIDFKSASAFLATAPTRAVAHQAGVAVDWQPYLVPSSKDHGAGSDSSRGDRHRRLRADYIGRDAMRYAAGQGLTLQNLHRQTDSSLAAAGLLWMRRESPKLADEYVRQVFERYWREELKIEDEDALRALLAEIGAPTAGFAAYLRGDGRAELERLQSELSKAGIFEVPSYLLDDKIYVGRQHLPLISATLSGGG